jgi:hypothetical protein
MLRFPGSQENTQAGFQVAFDTVDKEPMFATLGKDPVRGRRFGGAMVSLTGGEGYEVKHFVDNYDMGAINDNSGTFVDVGGSHGFVCVDLAKKYEKITFQGYNFYTPQPVKGADGKFFISIASCVSEMV